MQRYGAYKDSGVEWIGEIPAGWTCERIQNLFSEEKRINTALERNNALKFSAGTIVEKDEKWSADEMAETHSAYRIVDPGTIMINNLNLNFDLKSQRVGLVNQEGIITSAYLALIPGDLVIPEYAEYMFKSWDYRKAFHGMGRGLRLTLDWNELRTKWFPCPSFFEQQAIAGYLDAKTAEIDSIVSQTERSIELLREYRKSLISEAVTKGLDPNAPMRDSGVEWIGEIPEGWEVKAVKYLCRLQTGHTPPSEMLEYYGGERNWFTPGDIQNCIADVSSRRLTQKAFDDRQVPVYPPGSTLMVAIGATAGKVGFAPNESSSNQQITSFSPNGCFSKWLFYSLLNERERLFNLALFTTMPILNNDYLSKYQIAVPPLPEQQAIADYLDAKTAEIDSLIADKQRQVELLREYRKSLISEAVTGKFKVPGLE